MNALWDWIIVGAGLAIGKLIVVLAVIVLIISLLGVARVIIKIIKEESE